ncbi:MAG: cache domain-containing protein [Candidatus Merdivicinus sp.]|jgi:hypothetical protein
MNRLLRSRGHFQTLIFSYLVVFFIPIVLIGYLFANNIHILKRDNQQYNSSILQQVRIHLDESLRILMDISYQISLSENLNSVMYVQNGFEENNMYDIRMLQNELRRYRMDHSFIEDMYIYFPKTDTVLSEKNHVPKDTYFQLYLQPLYMDQSGWEAIIGDSFFGEMGTFAVREKGTDGMMTYFIQSIPTYNATSANLIIILDEEEIFSSLEQLNYADGDEISLVDKNGKTLMSSNPKRFLYGFDSPVLTRGLSTYMEESHVSSLQYVAVFSETEINAKIWKQIFYAVIEILVLLILGTAAILFFAFREHKPVAKLLKKLEPEYNQVDCPQNEWECMETAVDKIFNRQFFELFLEGELPAVSLDFERSGYVLACIKGVGTRMMDMFLSDLQQKEFVYHISELDDQVFLLFNLEKEHLDALLNLFRDRFQNTPPRVGKETVRYTQW